MNTQHLKKSAVLALSIVAYCAAHAQYEGVRFYGQNLSGHDFGGMNLEGADFSYATSLSGANFSAAEIYGTSFNGTVSKGFTEAMFKSTQSYADGRIYAAIYSNNMSGWDFSGLDMRDSIFTAGSGSVSGANFTDSDIRGAYMYAADDAGFTKEQLYSTASYNNKELTGIRLDDVNVSGWDFSGQNLTGTHFTMSTVDQNTSFANAIVNGVSFTHTTGFTADMLYTTASYKNGNLQGIILEWGDYSGWNFAGQDLTGASFHASVLVGADFTDAIITGARFHYEKTDSIGYDPNNSLTYAQLQSTKSYKDGDLRGIYLGGKGGTVGRDLGGWDFSNMNLEGASFWNANVRNAIFTDANIKGANFTREFDSFGEAGRNTTETLTAAQLYSTASYKEKDLEGVNFSGISLAGWDFSGQNMENVNFSSTNLTGTDLSGAIIKGGRFYNTVNYGFTKEQFYLTQSYIDKDLHGVDFTYNNLSGWDFTGQDLTNSNFYRTTLSDETNFTGAIILGACLQNAAGAQFTEAMLKSTKSYADKDLRGIYFTGGNIQGWDFTGQNLQNSSIASLNLTGVNFTNADLRGANTNSVTNLDAATIKNTIWSDGVVKNMTLAADDDNLVVKNYIPHAGAVDVESPYVITTKISDNDVIMTGGKLIIETGAPLALVQHKSLTADGGQIVMNYGEDGFGVINVYGSELGQSNFIITENTEYYIDFGVFGPDADEYLLVDATYGGNIVGDVEDIKYSVWDNGVDVSEEWEFKLVGDQLKLVLVIPEASAYAAVLGLIALAMAAYRRRK